MIYEAIVIDNSKFFERGTITVRIANFYFGNMTWNLVDDFPNSITDNQIEGIDYKTLDFEAIVHSSMGGGRNYGLFVMPQINEKGIVSFLNGSEKKVVWLGSVFYPIKNDDFEIEAVNIPSDKLEAEGENQDGSLKGVNNLDAEDNKEALKKNIILRTKNTTFVENDKDQIDWQKVPTSNIVSLGNKEIKVIHFADEDGWNKTTPEKYQQIILNKTDDGNIIQFSNINTADSKESRIDILEDTITLYTNGENGENTFTVSSSEDNGLMLTDVNGNQIILNSDGITIKSIGKTQINGSDDITINSDSNVNITGGKVILQGDDGGAVRIKELKSLMGKWEKHGHICPSGPTVGGPTDGTPTPLSPQLISDKQNLESKDVGMK